MENTQNQGWDAISDGKKGAKSKGSDKFKSNYNEDLFMKLPNGEHRIRLVGKAPHSVYVAWIANPYKKDEKVAKGKESKIKVIVPEAYMDRLKSLNIIPRENHAMLCFDRADTAVGKTRLKILEKGPTIFRAFKSWAKAHAKDGVLISPGDAKKGPEWYIEANVPDNILETTYQITPLESNPFTEVEVKLLKSDPNSEENKDKPLGERGLIDLKKYYEEEKEKSKKILEKFFEINNSLDSTQSVDDFVEKKPKAEAINSLDELPSSEAEVDEDSASSFDEQLEKLW